MKNKKFLNPKARIIICAMGIMIIGYFIFEDFSSSKTMDGTFYVRVFVFCAFGFFLVRSIIQSMGAR